MSKKTEDQPKKADKERRDKEEWRPKRKPRGALFNSGDPTLAQRLEEELYDFGRD